MVAAMNWPLATIQGLEPGEEGSPSKVNAVKLDPSTPTSTTRLSCPNASTGALGSSGTGHAQRVPFGGGVTGSGLGVGFVEGGGLAGGGSRLAGAPSVTTSPQPATEQSETAARSALTTWMDDSGLEKAAKRMSTSEQDRVEVVSPISL